MKSYTGLRKSQLSFARQKLVELMQKLNFARIEGLLVRAGEPAFEPPPRVLQDLKIPGENDPRVELYLRDFALKEAHCLLFRHLDDVGEGVVSVLEIRHGLPARLLVERPAA